MIERRSLSQMQDGKRILILKKNRDLSFAQHNQSRGSNFSKQRATEERELEEEKERVRRRSSSGFALKVV